MQDTIKNDLVTAFRIPAPDEEPSEEMIAWLNTCPIDWDGDGDGVTLYHEYVLTEVSVLATHGDWVVEMAGQWFVLSHQAMGVLCDHYRRGRVH